MRYQHVNTQNDFPVCTKIFNRVAGVEKLIDNKIINLGLSIYEKNDCCFMPTTIINSNRLRWKF